MKYFNDNVFIMESWMDTTIVCSMSEIDQRSSSRRLYIGWLCCKKLFCFLLFSFIFLKNFLQQENALSVNGKLTIFSRRCFWIKHHFTILIDKNKSKLVHRFVHNHLPSDLWLFHFNARLLSRQYRSMSNQSQLMSVD